MSRYLPLAALVLAAACRQYAPESEGSSARTPVSDVATGGDSVAEDVMNGDVSHRADTHGEGGDKIFFQSGFESGVTVRETGTSRCSGNLLGSDGLERGDWQADMESAPVDEVTFCYGGADDSVAAGCEVSQRGIELIEDPEEPSNTVLRTWVAEPAENVSDSDDLACSCVAGADTAGAVCDDLPVDAQGKVIDGFDSNGARNVRVQMAIYAQDGASFLSYSYRVRMRLGAASRQLNESFRARLNG